MRKRLAPTVSNAAASPSRDADRASPWAAEAKHTQTRRASLTACKGA